MEPIRGHSSKASSSPMVLLFDHCRSSWELKREVYARDVGIWVSARVVKKEKVPGRCHTDEVWSQASEERAGPFSLQDQPVQGEDFSSDKHSCH